MVFFSLTAAPFSLKIKITHQHGALAGKTHARPAVKLDVLWPPSLGRAYAQPVFARGATISDSGTPTAATEWAPPPPAS